MERVVDSSYIDFGIFPASYSRDSFEEQTLEVITQCKETQFYSLERHTQLLLGLCEVTGVAQSKCQRVIERLMPIVKRCLAQVAEQAKAPPKEKLDQFEGEALSRLFRVGRGHIVDNKVRIFFEERIKHTHDGNPYWELKLETPFENGEVVIQTFGRIPRPEKDENEKDRIAQLEETREAAKSKRTGENSGHMINERVTPVLTQQMLSVEAIVLYISLIAAIISTGRVQFGGEPTFNFKYVEPGRGNPHAVFSIKSPLCNEEEHVLPDITPDMRKQVFFGPDHQDGGKLSKDAWLGLETPVELRDLLEERGHLTVKGEFGPTYYEAQPKQATLHGQKVNYWPKDSVRKDGEHCEVKIVGCDWKERVFYRVKDDEHVYVMSWKRFKENSQS